MSRAVRIVLLSVILINAYCLMLPLRNWKMGLNLTVVSKEYAILNNQSFVLMIAY